MNQTPERHVYLRDEAISHLDLPEALFDALKIPYLDVGGHVRFRREVIQELHAQNHNHLVWDALRTLQIHIDINEFNQEHPPLVYFLRSHEFVKIGMTRKLGNRYRQINSSNPFPISVMHVLYGDEQDEKALHTRFRHYHVKGEWYRLTGELLFYLTEQMEIRLGIV